MKVTVCQLHDDRKSFADDWQRLVAHVQNEQSALVLLPDMPFYEWSFAKRTFDATTWRAAVHAHDEWEGRLRELAPAVVLGSRPIDFGNERYDEGFAWDSEYGLRSAHAKAYVSDRDGHWESSWYVSATPEFEPISLGVRGAHGPVSAGFLIGAELWLTEQARLYGMEHVHLLASPRATASASEQWLTVGRTAAAVAHTYGLSSNRVGGHPHFDGHGWIVDPQGDVLAITDESSPFASIHLDLSRVADRTRGPLRTTTQYGSDTAIE
jgi:N-carbamoylputrescine amidase